MLIHDFTVSTVHIQNIIGRQYSTQHIELLRKHSLFLTISILNFSFLSSSMFVLLFEYMLPKSNAYANIRIIALFFGIGNIFLILLCTYRKNWDNMIILYVEMSLLKKSRMC